MNRLDMLGSGRYMTNGSERLRQQILDLTARYFAEAFPATEFQPGITPVPVSGKVIDAADVSAVVDSALDAWFTTGRFAEDFERKLARFVGVRCASLVNSGSSANLLALTALTSPKLGDRRILDLACIGLEVAKTPPESGVAAER